MEKKISFKKAWKEAAKGHIVMRRTGFTDRRYLRISTAERVQCFLENHVGQEREVPVCVEDLRAKDWVVVLPPKIICDRCGKSAKPREGAGTCSECGADLCFQCGRWTSKKDDGRCEQCRAKVVGHVSEPPKTIDDIICDRCGKPAEFNEGGGNCPDCGDDLCFDCGQWTSEEDDERCEKCRKEAKEKFKPCPFCKRTDVLTEKCPGRCISASGVSCDNWGISCNYCGIGREGFVDEQEAIDWWNTRPNNEEG